MKMDNKLNIFFLLASLLCCCRIVSGLFEDQIGKFDWRLENIGNVTHAVFDSSSKNKQLIVASEENVVAAIQTATGAVAWRHVMEEDTPVLHMFTVESGVYTITTSHIRKWNAVHSYLIWDTSYPNQIKPGRFTILENTLVLLIGDNVLAISLSSGQEVWSVPHTISQSSNIIATTADDTVYIASIKGSSITVYIVRDELISEYKTTTLPSPGYRCVAEADWLACYLPSSSTVVMVRLSMKSASTGKYTLDKATEGAIEKLVINKAGYLIVQSSRSGTLYKLSDAAATLVTQYQGVASITRSTNSKDVLIAAYTDTQGVEIRGYDIEANGQPISAYSQSIEITSTVAQPQFIQPLIYTKAGSTESYRIFAKFEDMTLGLLQQTGNALWAREEGLSAIVALEMVDLPVSDVEAQMEEEFGAHAAEGLISQVASRIVAQFQQINSFLLHAYHKHVTGLRTVLQTADHTDLDEDYLTRDEFNLHKMIIAICSTGKIYGLDSYTGKVIWSHYVPELKPFGSSNQLLLFIQRTTAHVPHPAVATVVGQNAACVDCGSLLYSFNPITGEPYTPKPEILRFKIDQVMMIPYMQEDYSKPLLFLDTVKQVHIYPSHAQIDISPLEFYFYSALPSTGEIVGLQVTGQSLQSLEAIPTWNLSLKEKILTIKSKRWRENVHSLGKVLADRSVLYKYSNPNLISLITEVGGSAKSQGQPGLMVYLFDAITGRVIFSCEHQKSTPPVHMVHSENWVVYTYYNIKGRRVEIAVLELYEGAKQTNATVFSSLESNINPIVMKQAYILGTSVSALSTTITERGITSKNILLARTAGGIVEVPKVLLDPRRPQNPTPASKEEGLTPYMPELPMSYEWTINYNQSVYRVRDIHSEPAGLESISLIVAYGLDVYHTRVAPSKMYDVLKDDFDYVFIGGVTLGMIVMSIVSRHFALRKLVRRAWK